MAPEAASEEPKKTKKERPGRVRPEIFRYKHPDQIVNLPRQDVALLYDGAIQAIEDHLTAASYFNLSDSLDLLKEDREKWLAWFDLDETERREHDQRRAFAEGLFSIMNGVFSSGQENGVSVNVTKPAYFRMGTVASFVHDNEAGEMSHGEDAIRSDQSKLELALHGTEKIVETDVGRESRLVPNADLDAMTSAYLFDLAGVRHDVVHFVEKGGTKPGALNLDTGGRRGYAVERLPIPDQEGEPVPTAFIDHHSIGASNLPTSAARRTYDLLVKAGRLERSPWLERLVNFVTRHDNLAYELAPGRPVSSRMNYFKTRFGKTLYATHRELPFRFIVEYFRAGGDPWQPLDSEKAQPAVEAALQAVAEPGRWEGERRIDPEEITKIIGRRVYDAWSDTRAINAAKKAMELTHRDVRNSILKRTLVVVPNEPVPGLMYKKKPVTQDSLRYGFTAAKAHGYNTYIIWKDDGRGFFINSRSDLMPIYRKLKDLVPDAVLVRGHMLLRTNRVDATPFPFEKFLELINDMPEGPTAGEVPLEEGTGEQQPSIEGEAVSETVSSEIGASEAETAAAEAAPTSEAVSSPEVVPQTPGGKSLSESFAAAEARREVSREAKEAATAHRAQPETPPTQPTAEGGIQSSVQISRERKIVTVDTESGWQTFLTWSGIKPLWSTVAGLSRWGGGGFASLGERLNRKTWSRAKMFWSNRHLQYHDRQSARLNNDIVRRDRKITALQERLNRLGEGSTRRHFKLQRQISNLEVKKDAVLRKLRFRENKKAVYENLTKNILTNLTRRVEKRLIPYERRVQAYRNTKAEYHGLVEAEEERRAQVATGLAELRQQQMKLPWFGGGRREVQRDIRALERELRVIDKSIRKYRRKENHTDFWLTRADRIADRKWRGKARFYALRSQELAKMKHYPAADREVPLNAAFQPLTLRSAPRTSTELPSAGGREAAPAPREAEAKPVLITRRDFFGKWNGRAAPGFKLNEAKQTELLKAVGLDPKAADVPLPQLRQAMNNHISALQAQRAPRANVLRAQKLLDTMMRYYEGTSKTS